MRKSEIPPQLIQSYRLAQYRIADGNHRFCIRIDRLSYGLAHLLQTHGANSAALITAHNPRGVVQSTWHNRKMQSLLISTLDSQGFRHLQAVGCDPQRRWPAEVSRLILAIDLEAATQLGQKFLQNAIVYADRDSVPRLVLVR